MEQDQSTYSILVAKTEFINDVLGFQQGLNFMQFNTFYEKAFPYTYAQIRSEAEQDLAGRQYLPSFPVIKRLGEGKMLFKLYQRTKQVGESRLAGRYSITFGGHVEDSNGEDDFVYVGGKLDIAATIEKNRNRERDEELRFLHNKVEMRSLDNEKRRMHFEDYGFLVDNTIEIDKASGEPKRISVGQVHFALLFNLYVDPGIEVEIRDPALLDKGEHTLEDLLTKHLAGEIELEPWSLILVKHFLALLNGDFLSEKMTEAMGGEENIAAMAQAIEEAAQ